MAIQIMKKIVESPKGDTTKMYNREEFLNRINDITAGRIKPSKTEVVKKTPGKKTYAVIEKTGDTTKVTKEEFEKRIKE